MTRFYKTNPNCTSGKIKLTSPLDGAESSNGDLWSCEGSGLSGLLVNGLIMLARDFSVDFATYQSLRSQHSPVISCLDSNCGLPSF